MLQGLTIRNFAIITNWEIDFESGFTVFTGETGAGKSILIDALEVLLGKPFGVSDIHPAAETAYIEGVFIKPKGVRLPDWLDLSDQDEPLIISRKLTRNKSTQNRINGESVSRKQLVELAPRLLQVVGQHAQLLLAQPDYQLAVLDRFGGKSLQAVKTEYIKAHNQYNVVKRKLADLDKARQKTASEQEFLKFQAQDIGQHDFKPDEEDALKHDKKILLNKEKIETSLYQLDQQFKALSDGINASLGALNTIADTDSDYSAWITWLNELELEFSDKRRSVQDKIGAQTRFSDQSLDDIESRLDLIFRYTRKYHVPSLQALVEHHHALQTQLDQMVHGADLWDEMSATFKKAEINARKMAANLTQARRVAAKQLSKGIQATLGQLGFNGAGCEISIDPSDHLTLNGMDEVCFYIEPNPGLGLLPIQKIASGGELSRLLLAVLVVIADQDPLPTFVFDEIDTGVGGLIALTMGEKLKVLASSKQIVCVTHLAQIAKFADHHFWVEKGVVSGKTQTQVKSLTPAEAKRELKRMVGGDSVLQTVSG